MDTTTGRETALNRNEKTEHNTEKIPVAMGNFLRLTLGLALILLKVPIRARYATRLTPIIGKKGEPTNCYIPSAWFLWEGEKQNT